jgi:hypothetical protein
MKRWTKTKKKIKNLIKFCIFISLVSLPFITITQILGMEAFLDSFENPSHYICLQDKDNTFGLNTKNEEYLIIQKSSHPEFNIKKSDSIIYCKNNGDIACNKIYNINNIGAIKIYYTTQENDGISQPIYENQIIGKIITTIDSNIWNFISIKIWEVSINNLNSRVLLARN